MATKKRRKQWIAGTTKRRNAIIGSGGSNLNILIDARVTRSLEILLRRHGLNKTETVTWLLNYAAEHKELTPPKA